MTRWRPSDCGCVLDVEFPGAEAVTLVQVWRRCPFHASVLDTQIVGVLVAENRGKSRFRTWLTEQDEYGQLSTSGDGSRTRVFKPGIVFTAGFTGIGATRVLRVRLAGADVTLPDRQTRLLAFLAGSLLAGRVVVE